MELALGCGQVMTWGLVFLIHSQSSGSPPSASCVRVLGLVVSTVNTQSKCLPSWNLHEDWNKIHTSLSLEALHALSLACFSDFIPCHLTPCSLCFCLLLFLKPTKLLPPSRALHLLFRLSRIRFPPDVRVTGSFSSLSSLIKRPLSWPLFSKKALPNPVTLKYSVFQF